MKRPTFSADARRRIESRRRDAEDVLLSALDAYWQGLDHDGRYSIIRDVPKIQRVAELSDDHAADLFDTRASELDSKSPDYGEYLEYVAADVFNRVSRPVWLERQVSWLEDTFDGLGNHKAYVDHIKAVLTTAKDGVRNSAADGPGRSARDVQPKSLPAVARPTGKGGRPVEDHTLRICKCWVDLGKPAITVNVCDQIATEVFPDKARSKPGSKSHKKLRDLISSAIRRSERVPTTVS